MAVIIKGFNFPRNDDGSIYKRGYDFHEVSIVMTLFVDLKTGEMYAEAWDPAGHHLGQKRFIIEEIPEPERRKDYA